MCGRVSRALQAPSSERLRAQQPGMLQPLPRRTSWLPCTRQTNHKNPTPGGSCGCLLPPVLTRLRVSVTNSRTVPGGPGVLELRELSKLKGCGVASGMFVQMLSRVMSDESGLKGQGVSVSE